MLLLGLGRAFPLIAFCMCTALATIATAQQRQIIVVVGAAGEPEYAEMFRTWESRWKAAAMEAGNSYQAIGLENELADSSSSEGADSDRNRLKSLIEDWNTKETEATNKVDRQLWIVLLGHGTFDGKQAKFNLRGADLSASDLKNWLEGKPDVSESVNQIVINCSSCSGPFINELVAPNRIVVTATQSGSQFNFARFGDFLSQQIAANRIDLDKDQRTSLLEIVLAAASDTASYYDSEKRLATEMATIDDNADGLGTPAEWFTGLRVTKIAKDHAPDGLRSNQVFFANSKESVPLSFEQRQEVERLELALEGLRRTKGSMEEALYFERLEELAVKIAQIYSGK